MTYYKAQSRFRRSALSILATTALLASPAYAASEPEKADTMMKTNPMMETDIKGVDEMMTSDAMKADGMMTPARFQKKSYALKGSVVVEQRGAQTVLVFSDDFRTKKGPDLKVFLSKNTLSNATGTNATTDAVRLGELTSNKGAQAYILPAGVNLADYSSVLIQCEAFSKLWGGADIS